jgi:hypothetical protein
MEDSFDYVHLWDGSSTEAHILTGEEGHNLVYNSVTNSLSLAIVSDESQTAPGFSAVVQYVPNSVCANDDDNDGVCDDADDCIDTGDIFLRSGETRQISSQDPQFHAYKNNMDCAQAYRGPTGSTVTVTLDYWLELDYDYLYVYDGGNNVGTLTGSGSFTYTSQRGEVRLHFDSDEWVVDEGYRGTVTATGGVQDDDGDEDDFMCDNGDKAIETLIRVGEPFNTMATVLCDPARHDCDNPDFVFYGTPMWNRGSDQAPENEGIVTCGIPEPPSGDDDKED